MDVNEFPKHAVSLCLTHNPHLAFFQTVAQWEENEDDDWVSDEEYAKALSTNEVWILQWYPHTPIGSYRLLASDLNVLLQTSREMNAYGQ